MITANVFGKTADGKEALIYTLVNAQGLEARVTAFGASLVSLRSPDRHGRLEHVALHPESFDACVRGFPLGSVIGRYANRIAGAAFAIDGVTHHLEANSGKHHIHGGGRKAGFQWQLWNAETFREQGAVGVRFSLVSPDGQAGFPGEVRAAVRYVLTDRNELGIDYSATCNQSTHVNLTNHAYWNLAGSDTGDFLNHRLTIHADQYLPIDETKMPTGEIRAVRGTPMDFTQAATIGSRIDQTDIKNYDHCYVLRKPAGQRLALAARVEEPTTGRTMDVLTTQPGVQFYTGNRRGFCLETQHFPNTPNEPKFPSTLLRPGQEYSERAVFRFGAAR